MTDMELAEEIEDSVKHGDAFWLRFSDDQWQQIIVALRRPPSGEMVPVPRELLSDLNSALYAAEAEGRKS